MKVNYSNLLEKKLENIEKSGLKPKLLLHSCCAPCSSYVIEYLAKYFCITVYYYNPNISPIDEYLKRKRESGNTAVFCCRRSLLKYRRQRCRTS